jgi:ABC-type spermidine/putrescine transport system permease subunit II
MALPGGLAGLGGGERTPIAWPDQLTVGFIAIATLVFLALPIVIVVPMSFSSAANLTFPPPGFSLRWYAAFFGDARWHQAALNSVLIAAVSSTMAMCLGTLAAYGLVRGSFRGRRLVEANFIAPLIVPPVVKAVAIYIAYAKTGLLGSYLGLIVAHTILGVPYVVLLMSVAIRSFDQRIEQVAASLGARFPTILRRVLLPNILPSLAAAWIMAFIVSFDEIIITFFVFGRRETIPKRMFTSLEQKIDPTITAIATLLILVSLLTLAAVALLLRQGGMLRRDAGAGQA